MAKINFTNGLRDEYRRLFDACEIRANRFASVDAIVSAIEANKDRYVAVGGPLGIPWYVVGVIHNMEASLKFTTHLHNGDPLKARTVQVPAGRPKTGSPPFTWEESADDALRQRGLNGLSDWSLPITLYRLEGYNGFGYRMGHPDVLSPYLWSFTNHYSKGKFVADHKFSHTAVSGQCGAAAIIRRMAEKGTIAFGADGQPVEGASPSVSDLVQNVRFSKTVKSVAAEQLQRALNNIPGIFLRVDGVPGKGTSDAVKAVTGHFLMGDPRA
ncbi:MAG: hypothetical protein JWQ98_628 [Chlorobi bacterium]|nr:hypothetical protein [Chlorobiota bacterium]